MQYFKKIPHRLSKSMLFDISKKVKTYSFAFDPYKKLYVSSLDETEIFIYNVKGNTLSVRLKNGNAFLNYFSGNGGIIKVEFYKHISWSEEKRFNSKYFYEILIVLNEKAYYESLL